MDLFKPTIITFGKTTWETLRDLKIDATITHEFIATVSEVTDGDTFKFILLLPNLAVKGSCRLVIVNAPEKYGLGKKEGLKAKEHLKQMIEGKKVLIVTFGHEKYGRWLSLAWMGNKFINGEMRDFIATEIYKK